jgi:hypothetical protein
MIRGSWVVDRHTGVLMPKDEWLQKRYADTSRRSDLPTPYIIGDSLGLHGLLNHADGKRYDSKSAYYGAVKAAGCEIIGNEKPTSKPKPIERVTGHEIKLAIEGLKAR